MHNTECTEYRMCCLHYNFINESPGEMLEVLQTNIGEGYSFQAKI